MTRGDDGIDWQAEALTWRQEALELRSLVEELRAEVMALRAENRALREENEALKAKVAGLERQNEQLLRRVLGPTSEKMPSIDRELRRRKTGTRKGGKKPRKQNAAARAKLETEEVEHPVPDGERTCACQPPTSRKGRTPRRAGCGGMRLAA